MDRREFVVATAAVGAGTLPSLADMRTRIDLTVTCSTAADIAHVREALERHGAGYQGRQPLLMLRQMRPELALLDGLLARPHRARDRLELARLTAGLYGLVAIVQHDRGANGAAHRWFAMAQSAARQAGDRRALAWLLARQAMVPLNFGSAATAVGLARQARRQAGNAPSAASALAAAVSARAFAALGDVEAATRAVLDARKLQADIGEAEQADTWFGYPPQKHHIHLSHALTLLGRADDADVEQRAALALTRSSSVMARSLIEVDAATCAFHDGDSANSAERAANVWAALAPAHREGLILARAQGLRERLTGAPRARLTEALRG